MKIKQFFYLSLILLAVIFYACDKDNPVVPPETEPGLDTASRYKWKAIDYLSNSIYTIYVADTNMIYVRFGTGLAYLKDSSLYHYELYDQKFKVVSINGYDRNNFFISGYTLVNSHYFPTIKKVTNGAISTTILDSAYADANDILVEGPNQAWICTYYNNLVFHYDNGNVTKYKLSNDNTIYIARLYKSPVNEIFAFATKVTNFLPGYHYTYKLVGDTFVNTKIGCYSPYNKECLTDYIYRCGPDLLMIHPFSREVRYFNGTDWVHHSNCAGGGAKIGGISKDSLVAFVYPLGNIYTYNGKVWRKEKTSPIILPLGLNVHSNIEAKFGNIYFAHADTQSEWGKIFIGKPNK